MILAAQNSSPTKACLEIPTEQILGMAEVNAMELAMQLHLESQVSLEQGALQELAPIRGFLVLDLVCLGAWRECRAYCLLVCGVDLQEWEVEVQPAWEVEVLPAWEVEVLLVCGVDWYGVDWPEWEEEEALPACGVDWREWEAEVLLVCGEHAGRVMPVSWVPSQMACMADYLPAMLALVAEVLADRKPLMLLVSAAVVVARLVYAADWKPLMLVWVVAARLVYVAGWNPLMLVSAGVVLLVCEYLQVACLLLLASLQGCGASHLACLACQAGQAHLQAFVAFCRCCTVFEVHLPLEFAAQHLPLPVFVAFCRCCMVFEVQLPLEFVAQPLPLPVFVAFCRCCTVFEVHLPLEFAAQPLPVFVAFYRVKGCAGPLSAAPVGVEGMCPAVRVRGVDGICIGVDGMPAGVIGIVFWTGVEGTSSAFPNGVPGASWAPRTGVAGTDCNTAAVPGVIGIAWPVGVAGTESRTFIVPGVAGAIFGVPGTAESSGGLGGAGPKLPIPARPCPCIEFSTGVAGTEFITWVVFGVMGAAKPVKLGVDGMEFNT
ncbi:unnamed protein product [Symbiodinium sp. CCMP2456]|nr:unnamed protein product [Symbiodinium sp. CCMP2456]